MSLLPSPIEIAAVAARDLVALRSHRVEMPHEHDERLLALGTAPDDRAIDADDLARATRLEAFRDEVRDRLFVARDAGDVHQPFE
jgi:hypothetical protein